MAGGDKKLSPELRAALLRVWTVGDAKQEPAPAGNDEAGSTPEAKRQRLHRKRWRGGKICLKLFADEDELVAALQRDKILTADEADMPSAIQRAAQEHCRLVTVRDAAKTRKLLELAFARGFLSSDEVDQ